MSDQTHDYVIVGGGAVGCVIAARLSEQSDKTVLLIEAGPDFPANDLPPDVANGLGISIGNHDWPCIAEAVPGRTMVYGHGKLMGGSSATNGTMALRGYPQDFDHWAEMGNPEWRWEKVLPYFKKLEHDLDIVSDDHGQSGPVPITRWKESELTPLGRAFREAAVEMGYPFNPDLNGPVHDRGIGVIPMNRRGTLRMSAALAYIEPARTRPNLTIMASCLADRIVFEGRKAVGVAVVDNGARRTILGREIIVSAGAVHSPPLLLRSGIGPKQDLDGWGIPVVHHNPNVGRNLYDHSQTCIGLIPRTPGFNAEYPDIQLLLNYTAPNSPHRDDMQLYLVDRLLLGRFPDYRPPAGVGLLVGLMSVLNQPESRGFITLNSVDPAVEPRIVLNLITHPSDAAGLLDGVRRSWALAQTKQMKEWYSDVAIVSAGVINDDAALTRYVRDTVATIWHPVATCKMGPAGDPTAVVDGFGRVYGVDNLRVADASIFPCPVSRNPNLTCYMLGELIADAVRAGR